MLILKSWLKDYIDIKENDERIAEILSLAGQSIEEIIKELDNKVIVVEIRKIEPHPNADRLKLATIFDGAKEIKIVCGATNIEVGQKVPLAQLGAKVVVGEIRKANIRGIDSEGMLCAADELGLSGDHSGIVILPKDYEVGKSLAEYASEDSVFDIEVTPNRGDCLSHLGIARELSVLTEQPLKQNKIQEINNHGAIKIDIADSNLCPQYHACEIKGVKVATSPEWLSRRLEKVGIKAINNIVDITNLVMLDLGQPLHAFDLKKIDDKIVVRLAETNESLNCLDGKERQLKLNNLVIADTNKPIAIAGIIGGANSEIDAETHDIVIEGAEFNPVSIRKSVKELAISTEASYRFERGIDSGSVRQAVVAAAQKIVELAGGEIVGISSFETEQKSISIKIEYEKIKNLIGLKIDNKQIDKILVSLGFLITSEIAMVPTWRHDITLWQDLAEEVARIIGYDKIPRNKLGQVEPPERSSYYTKEQIKDILTKIGFSEVFAYSFLSEKDLEIAKIEPIDLIEVANPIQPENKYLRNSLVPGLLRAVAKNPTFDPIAIFELGHIFTAENEKTYLGLMTSGKNSHQIIQDAISKLNLDIPIKQLTSDQLQQYKIRKPMTCVVEIDIDEIINKIDLQVKNEPLQAPETAFFYRNVSKYPSVVRDLAFIVNSNVSTTEIEKEIYTASDQILLIELFDEFTSDKFGEGKKNIAYHIWLQGIDQPMDEIIANEIFEKIISQLENKFSAKLRS